MLEHTLLDFDFKRFSYINLLFYKFSYIYFCILIFGIFCLYNQREKLSRYMRIYILIFFYRYNVNNLITSVIYNI